MRKTRNCYVRAKYTGPDDGGVLAFWNRNKEKALTGAGSVVSAIENGWQPVQLLGSGARDRILNIYNVAQGASYGWLYSKSPALRMVIDKIAKDVAALELRLYEEVSESERQPRPDHPAALSLRYPNDTTPASQLIEGLIVDYLIHSNAYAWLLPASGQQLWIQRLPAFMVEVQGSNLFRAENYRMWPQGAWTTAGAWGGAGTFQDFLPDQVFHWHGIHPQDLRVGLSKLDTLRGVLAEDAALQQTIVELASAGLQEPVWVSRPLDAPEWSPAAANAFEEDLANRIRRRTTKPIVLEEGMEMKSFGVTPHDAEMMALRKWAVAQVASEFDVPPGKVGLEPPSQEAEDDYNKDVLWPTCKSFTSMLNHRVLVGAYGWTAGCFVFNLDERLMGNNRLQALTSASGVPILLRNEARAMINKPPVEGGDDPATPANIVLGGDPEAQLVARASAAAPKPGSTVVPIQDPNKPSQDGSYREDQGQTPVPSGNRGKAFQPPESTPELPSSTDRLPQFHPRKAADIERQRRHVDSMQAVVQRHFNRLERSLRAKSATDWGRWDREFSQDLGKALHRVVQAEGDVYAVKLGASQAFDMGRVKNYLAAMAEGAAGAINDTVRGEIDQMGLDDALARGPQHVASAGSSLGARATLWARDEAAKQAPGYEGRVKMWIADTGRHAEFDGVTVGVGEDWPAGFAPGGVPGCQCSATIS